MCQQCMKLDLLHVKWHAWLMICGACSEAWVSPQVFIWQQCHRARVSNILCPLLFVSVRFPAPLWGYEDALLELEVMLSFDVGGNGFMGLGTLFAGAQMAVLGEASAFRFPSLPLFPRRKACYFEVPCFSVFPLFRIYSLIYFGALVSTQGIRHARQMPYHWAHRSLPLTRDNGAWSWAELSCISQNSHARISTVVGGGGDVFVPEV